MAEWTPEEVRGLYQRAERARRDAESRATYRRTDQSARHSEPMESEELASTHVLDRSSVGRLAVQSA